MTRRRSYPRRDTRLLILIVAAFSSSLSRYTRHWAARNPWFDAGVLPALRDAVQRALA
jgi:hypothetical protein